jgi:hypothetical protein
MIRLSLPLIALSLMGCARESAGNPYSIPAAPSEPTPCGSQHLGSFVGKTRTGAISAEVARSSGAKSIRWISPGMAVTMDYREDRLNVDLDDKGVITRFRCG